MRDIRMGEKRPDITAENRGSGRTGISTAVEEHEPERI
jgi:hypothetical protein